METAKPTTTITAKPYACPTCGETDEWVAHYMVPESQGVTLLVDPDGKEDGSTPLATDYDAGSRQSYDAGDDDFYQCGACGTTVTTNGDVEPHVASPGGIVALSPTVQP